MKTVTEISRITGVSVRTLHHYDAIGLLKPTQVTYSGYRLYDETALEKLQLILLFRELAFPLKQIGAILNAPDFERNRILGEQIDLLQKRREHLDNLMLLARGIRLTGVKDLDMKSFDVRTIDEQTAQAKVLWGKTEAYQEFEEKSRNRSKQQEQNLGDQVMDLFRELGTLKDGEPCGAQAQAWVRKLQSFFNEHYYNCTKEILLGLGGMYAAGGSFTENIDHAGGTGTAEFARKAIELYCK